jgi:hypothetical protein
VPPGRYRFNVTVTNPKTTVDSAPSWAFTFQSKSLCTSAFDLEVATSAPASSVTSSGLSAAMSPPIPSVYGVLGGFNPKAGAQTVVTIYVNFPIGSSSNVITLAAPDGFVFGADCSLDVSLYFLSPPASVASASALSAPVVSNTSFPTTSPLLPLGYETFSSSVRLLSCQRLSSSSPNVAVLTFSGLSGLQSNATKRTFSIVVTNAMSTSGDVTATTWTLSLGNVAVSFSGYRTRGFMQASMLPSHTTYVAYPPSASLPNYLVFQITPSVSVSGLGSAFSWLIPEGIELSSPCVSVEAATSRPGSSNVTAVDVKTGIPPKFLSLPSKQQLAQFAALTAPAALASLGGDLICVYNSFTRTMSLIVNSASFLAAAGSTVKVAFAVNNPSPTFFPPQDTWFSFWTTNPVNTSNAPCFLAGFEDYLKNPCAVDYGRVGSFAVTQAVPVYPLQLAPSSRWAHGWCLCLAR